MRTLLFATIAWAIMAMFVSLPAGALEAQPVADDTHWTDDPQLPSAITAARLLSAAAVGIVTTGYARDYISGKAPSPYPVLFVSIGFCLVCYGTSFSAEHNEALLRIKLYALLAGVGLQGVGALWFAMEGDEDLRGKDTLKGIAAVAGMTCFMLIYTYFLDVHD